jgi:uncharacterized protein (TIRG00374 family)
MNLIRLFPLVGIVLFLWILAGIDIPSTLRIISSADIPLLVFVFLINIPNLLIKSHKWRIFINSYDVKISLHKATSAWLAGFFLGLVTPGRVGDFSRGYYVKEQVPLGKAMTTVAVDRVIDLFVLFSLAIIGIIALFSMLLVNESFSFLLVAFITFFALFIFGTFAMTRKDLMRTLARPFFNRLIPRRYKNRLSITFNDFYEGLDSLKKNRVIFIISLILSFFSFFVIMCQSYLIALALKIPVSLTFILAIMPVIILIDALPISFSGIGTRDAALIFLFSLVGIAAESAISFSLIILFFNYIVFAFIGFLYWMKNPLKER